LLEIVLALRTASSLASLLDGRQKQCDQDGDNGDDDEQFYQRKGAATSMTNHE
jgi:hypothetical protein